MAVELVQEIGRRITMVTEDTRETAFSFPLLLIGEMQSPDSFLSTFTVTE